MRIIGLDPSLTATGICDVDPQVIHSRQSGAARMAELRDKIFARCALADLVLIEGFAMGTGRQSGSYDIGGLGWVVRLALYEVTIAYVEIPPATLKKFATNKGNAGKPDMLAAAIRSGYEGPNDNNAVDAWWLYQLGLYRFQPQSAGVATTAYRDESLGKVVWPLLNAVAKVGLGDDDAR